MKYVPEAPRRPPLASSRKEKGLMLAVTKIMLLSSSGNTHQDTHIGAGAVQTSKRYYE